MKKRTAATVLWFFTGWFVGAFVAFINGLVVVFGALLPWLVFLALIGGAVLLFVRWRRSKKAAAVSASAPASAP